MTDYIDKTMEYFINQKFHFDGINETIKPIGRDTPLIKLSKPSSRLLEELLTQPGITLSREELLQTVWENHGLTPSTSNLSNHISFLRKVFSQLGEHERTIITVPKEGFKIEASVTCKESEHTHDIKTMKIKPK
ncbi:winged helix-turn-helix domain-containing protein [Erwinia aphidicola]|uniref:winged helix-turn-helix domain-containing protein n=2 Tax=Erwinia aphidicola TaxID=68334 RepID=UPI0030CC2A6E